MRIVYVSMSAMQWSFLYTKFYASVIITHTKKYTILQWEKLSEKEKYKSEMSEETFGI